MKSINQIFSSNPELKESKEVKELIEYCQELEGQVIESTQSSKFSFEDKLASLVRDLYTSINEIEREEQEHKRFDFEKPDYEQAITNLGNYLRDFARDNKFRL